MTIARQQHYLRVIETMKEMIESGIYNENDRLPSDLELAQKFDVTRATLRKALTALEDERVLIRRHGLGLFINPKPIFTSGIEQLESVSAMIENAGMEPGTIFMDVSNTDPTDDCISQFDFDEDEKLVTIKRVRTADGDPVVYCIDNLLSKYLPNETEELFSVSIFDAIEQAGDVRIDQAIAHIEPVGYDEEASSILRCGVDVPLLVLKQRHYTEDGEMVLYSKNYFRADKFSFHVVRKRV
ncbi:GntR family transcriptional regulator [Sporosarcina jiandibaonis]|uniref:GntR family transcriptional regulator n=1 Tax=Sporosarcina jiandibaonis TaxID=2715535 RepID=UPI0015575183|nr:GntR family transcriptional regulator [Sporosarcina jiandibaonis]